MRQYKTIRGMARHIAMLAVSSEAYNKGRWIRRAVDFNEDEIIQVRNKAHALETVLLNADGRKWEKEVFPELHDICGKDFHFGFKGQDDIINICENFGIHIIV